MTNFLHQSIKSYQSSNVIENSTWVQIYLKKQEVQHV